MADAAVLPRHRRARLAVDEKWRADNLCHAAPSMLVAHHEILEANHGLRNAWRQRRNAENARTAGVADKSVLAWQWLAATDNECRHGYRAGSARRRQLAMDDADGAVVVTCRSSQMPARIDRACRQELWRITDSSARSKILMARRSVS